MYQYKYIEIKAATMLSKSSHREIIEEWSSKGWRFIGVIPTEFFGYGKIQKFDLIFEKIEN